jgi:hypothetical protein
VTECCRKIKPTNGQDGSDELGAAKPAQSVEKRITVPSATVGTNFDGDIELITPRW